MRKHNALLLPLFFLMGCHEVPPVPNSSMLPWAFDFVLLEKDGSPVFKTTRTIVELFYDRNGEMETLTSCLGSGCTGLREFNEPTAFPLYYTSLETAARSSSGSSKTFYIKVNNDIDTIYLDVEEIKNVVPAGTYTYVYRKVGFNGREVEVNKQTMPWVYVLKR